MKAIILAAGRGSRMHEGTKDIPKCMMRVHGKTLLERCLESLRLSGFNNKDIAIVTGYKNEIIENTIGDDITFFHNDIWDKTNMVYSLTKAESWLTNNECCVFYSDIIFSPEAVKRTMSIKGDIVIPYYTEYLNLWKMRFDNPLEDLETFKTDGNDCLINIGSRPTSYDQVHGQYMGIVKLTPRGWSLFINSVSKTTKTIEKIDMTSLLAGTINNNHTIKCVACSELWLECDNLNDISVYESHYNDIL